MSLDHIFSNEIDGIMRCSRYSFGPNRLHYCGPDANKELKELIEKDGDNFELSHLLQQFKTLFPYLREIATANNIDDPFDEKVVEAYWLGNNLLENLRNKKFYNFLVDNLRTKNKMSVKEFVYLEKKIKAGALPHHSFHVLNVWAQGGHGDGLEALERINECLISSGVVKEIKGPEIIVKTELLVYKAGQIAFDTPVLKSITRQLECEYDIEQICPGQTVSIHWSVPCEIITLTQAARLREITLKNIAFANLNN